MGSRASLEFTLSDRTTVANLESSLDFVSSGFGLQRLEDIERTKVAKTVGLGDEFRFVFDLEDNWVHRCEVHPVKIDPVETLGIRPSTPCLLGMGRHARPVRAPLERRRRRVPARLPRPA